MNRIPPTVDVLVLHLQGQGHRHFRLLRHTFQIFSQLLHHLTQLFILVAELSAQTGSANQLVKLGRLGFLCADCGSERLSLLQATLLEQFVLLLETLVVLLERNQPGHRRLCQISRLRLVQLTLLEVAEMAHR